MVSVNLHKGYQYPDVAGDRNSIGNAWYSLVEYQKSIDYYEQALVTMEKKLKNHPKTEALRNNLTDAREKLAGSATQ